MKTNTKKWFYASLMVLLIPSWGVAQVASPIQQHPVGKITIAIEDFKNKDSDVGRGISDMLESDLSATDRFDLVARGEDLLRIYHEIKINQIGGMDEEKANTLKRADYLITGNVMAFENPQGGGGFNFWGNNFNFHTHAAHVKVTVRIIEMKTGTEKVITGEGEKKISSVDYGNPNLNIHDPGFNGSPLGQATQMAVNSLVVQITDYLNTKVGAPPPPPPQVTPTPIPRVSDGIRNPKIMVIIPEAYTRHLVPDPAAETQIIRLLTEHNFDCVDKAQVDKILEADEMREVINKVIEGKKIDEAQAIEIALRYKNKADIVVVGEAFAEFITQHETETGGLISCQAHVEARAIRTDTGSIICANDFDGSALKIGEFVSAKAALENAGIKYGNYLIEQLQQKESGGLVPTALTIQVVVSKVKFEQLSQLEDSWKNIEGVQRIDLHYEGTAKQGTVNVVFAGDAEELAKALLKSKSIEVTGLSANRIEVDFKEAVKDPPTNSDQQEKISPQSLQTSSEQITPPAKDEKESKIKNVKLSEVKMNVDKYKGTIIKWTGRVMEDEKENSCMVEVSGQGSFIVTDIDPKTALTKNQSVTVVGKIINNEEEENSLGTRKNVYPVVKAITIK
jgi:curli biogenesis system outer membrane secretion channel CsgG